MEFDPEHVLRPAEGRTREDLDADPTLGLSPWKLLEIIGKAAGRVSSSTRTLVIWKTVVEDLPLLVPSLERLVMEFEGTQPEKG